MTIIPQRELRNHVGEFLSPAEAGERMTITVSGRPVAELGPLLRRQWVDTAALGEVWRLPPDPMLAEAIEAFRADLSDPWAP